MLESICSIVRDLENNYVNNTTAISKYVSYDQYENINKIDAYINSVHISGDVDSKGREKPFFNIVTAARNIWLRATDIDRKNINLKVPNSKLLVETFCANMLLKQWMRKAQWGIFLNEWGRTLATYGSAVCKFIEKDGELKSIVVPWNRIICDKIDFNNNVNVEVLEFTSAQLKQQKGYDKEMVKSLLDAVTSREDLNHQNKDNKADYIKVYEVHGNLPLSLLTEDEKDEETFVQQMHVISFIGQNSYGKGDYKDFTLYKGKEKKNPYQIDSLIKEDGRTMGIGSVENLFQAQWMVNHSAKQIKDTLDLASLLILQTSDGSLAGRNVLNSMVTGDLLIHGENQPITQLNNQHDISQIQSFAAQWQNQAKEIVQTPDAIAGINPSGQTAYRLQQLVTNEAHSLFELMTENKGLGIERMLREYIIPFIKTQMDNTDEITDILSSENITQFDSMYVPNEAIRRNNKRIIDTVLSGDIAEQGDVNQLHPEIQKELSTLGSQRFIKPSDLDNKTWKELLKDFEWQVEIDVTAESTDTAAALTTLQSTFQTIVSLAGRPMTPDEKLIFSQIMERAGTVSPLQLNQTPTQQPQQQQQLTQTQPQ